MVLTLGGMTTSVKPVQPSNAPYRTLVTTRPSMVSGMTSSPVTQPPLMVTVPSSLTAQFKSALAASGTASSRASRVVDLKSDFILVVPFLVACVLRLG